MQSKELKKILKPLIKQCIREVVLEEGLLSNIVSEVVQGLGAQPIVESSQPARVASKQDDSQIKKQLSETKQRMMKAIGSDGYNGVDLFEDTKPLSRKQATAGPGSNPLDGYAPEDSGVNIDGILKIGGAKWKNLI
jgi:hypothetical protein